VLHLVDGGRLKLDVNGLATTDKVTLRGIFSHWVDV
jgi:hypothetical protein